jgi:hypothetical protein
MIGPSALLQQRDRYTQREEGKMPDPLFGQDWKLDRGKSSLSVASFNPHTETQRYEEVPGGYRLTVTGSTAGQTYSWNYTALNDGKPHPVHGRNDVDSITTYRINDKITVGFFTKDGVAGGPYARFVSDDGRTLTVWAGGKNANGEPYFDVLHYDL